MIEATYSKKVSTVNDFDIIPSRPHGRVSVDRVMWVGEKWLRTHVEFGATTEHFGRVTWYLVNL